MILSKLTFALQHQPIFYANNSQVVTSWFWLPIYRKSSLARLIMHLVLLGKPDHFLAATLFLNKFDYVSGFLKLVVLIVQTLQIDQSQKPSLVLNSIVLLHEANGILQAFLGLLQLPAASFEERVVVEKSYLLLESGVLGGQVVGASGFGHKLIGFGRVVGGHGEVGQL